MDFKKPDYYLFYREARYFEKAAKTLYENKPDDLSETPIYYLIGHSIELSLKSYLITENYSMNALKRIGHNLEKLFDKSLKCNNFNSTFSLKEDISIVKENIESLNYYYCKKHFEYPLSGLKIVPILDWLFQFLNNILNGCKILCEDLINKNYRP